MIAAAAASLALADGLTASAYPGDRVSNPKPRKRYTAPTALAAAPTDADRERIRLAEQKRARKAARQAKGMTERQCQGRA